MKKLLFSISLENSIPAEFFQTLLRVFTGLAMSFGHGLGKLPPSEKFIEGVSTLGFPAPIFFAWSAGLAEFLGGVFLALGLLTRASAIFISITMIVAAFMRHAEDPFKLKELSLIYLVIAMLFVVKGAGKWSLDSFIKK